MRNIMIFFFSAEQAQPMLCVFVPYNIIRNVLGQRIQSLQTLHRRSLQPGFSDRQLSTVVHSWTKKD